MASSKTTDSNFQQDVLGSDKLVLVDFWAEWCGPCRSLAPKLEEISDEMASDLNVIKLNIDENPDAPAKYGVLGIPTMILFKGGEEIHQIVGNHSKENIVALIQKHTQDLKHTQPARYDGGQEAHSWTVNLRAP